MERNPTNLATHSVVSLVLRRMRRPLIILICSYAIAVLGMVLIPGVDDQGQPWRMDFFHAFYFVSYMATTIGFGEIPYAFTDAQRGWATFSMYMTVIAWLYAIGNILTLIQDPALKRAVTENQFFRSVARIREPFYLVCGYGDTGSLVIRGLSQRGIRAVALDIEQHRINELLLTDHELYVPGLTGNAADSELLRLSGLASPHCIGVMALTDDDHANLKIAITSKLLRPKLRVICRAEDKSVQANMASFGTDYIFNPFDSFADQLAIALHSPNMHKIFEWLTQLRETPLVEHEPPPHGRWIICGYGRFGKAVNKYMKMEGLQTVIIEAHPDKTGCTEDCIEGRGTEAVTLRVANIKDSVGIVAGTNDDANNLSIIMTAKDLKPDIYTVARQNRRRNSIIFDAADINLTAQHSRILALKILSLATVPLLNEFFHQARHMSEDWAAELVERLRTLAHGNSPDIWMVTIDAQCTPPVTDARLCGRRVFLGHLTSNPHDRDHQLRCLPLMLTRERQHQLLPGPSILLEAGDQLLMAGSYGTADSMLRTQHDYNVLRYIETGETRPDGLVWRWLAKKTNT